MNLSLHNKKALVCGSTQGIGKAMAVELAKLGCSIVLFARDESKLRHVIDELEKSENQEHTYLVADFQQPAEVMSRVENYLEANEAPTILINNTGGPSMGELIEEDYSKFEKTFSAHLENNHNLTKALVPYMKEQQFGRIINVVSTSVYVPIPGLGVSNTTRAAVAGWAKTLSIELGSYGITVNNVLPGMTATSRLDSIIETKMKETGMPRKTIEMQMNEGTPARRFGTAEEVAALAAFLASPSASYINGVSIPVDGGRTGCI